MPTNDPSHKKVYGRGYRDGVKAALQERDIEMNHARQEQLLAGQSGIARKVFEATPIGEAWSAHQIRTELARLGATNDIRIIDGCLRTLAETGLIQEPTRGFFKRKPERVVAPIHEVKDVKLIRANDSASAPQPPRTEPAAATASPLEVLCGISARMAEIAASMKQLQKDIDDAAIVIEQRFSESEGRNEKLIQLQQLLKSLG